MTEKERASCINTIEALRRAVFNANGMLYAIDTVNCEKIITMLKQPERKMIDATLSGLEERICEVICNRFGVSPTEGYEIADEILEGWGTDEEDEREDSQI